ncbi:TPA: hypothetical protein ACX3MK_005112 [Raoultella ornithinolytica]
MWRLKIVTFCLLGLYFISTPSSAQSVTPSIMGKLPVDDELKSSYMTGVYVSRDTFGLRANAAAAAITANTMTPFTFPIIGLNFMKALASYKDRDSVGLYVGNASSPFKPWERVSSGKYTPTSFESDSLDTQKIKPGMIIDTMHKDRWSAVVVKVSPGKIITNGWVSLSTGKIGVPPGTDGIIINPTTKVWTTNFNVSLSANGRASKAVVQENGVINNKVENPSSVYGIDNIVLPQSKYGGTISFLSRSATSGNKQQWSVGFMARGSKDANFSSVDGSANKTTQTGYSENSSAVNGMVFNGKNKDSSVKWISNGKVLAKISPSGQFEKISYKTKVLTESSQLDSNYSKFIINSKSDVRLQLPSPKNEVDGLTIQIVNFSGHKIDISPSPEVDISKTTGKEISASVINGRWMVY